MLDVYAEKDIWILGLTGRFTGWGFCKALHPWQRRRPRTRSANNGSAARCLGSSRFPLQKSCLSCWRYCLGEASRVWVWPLASCGCTPARVLSCTPQPTASRSSTYTWWAFSVASRSLRCLRVVFHSSCSPVPGVRGSSCWPSLQQSSSSSCTIAAILRKVFGHLFSVTF